MTNITNNSEITQRGVLGQPNEVVNYLDNDCYDDLVRLLTQTSSLLNFMIGNDNTKGISNEIVSDLIWIATDKLTEIKTQFEALPKARLRVKNGLDKKRK
ncbi:hypothetical protein [Pseudoalteromonas sp. MEBiC 03485]|uniref:hypothetical protein n=1 Tax=Pseudoalteromonas sp. MEBiC 03485 TaxID=2571103 RepID=UPI00101E8AA9|nr:hypothetical protein [Pseudoalteromonas sp. MEBiC 03485]RZD19650.1 hypothetical protein EVU92_20840 [Pseudoalteromonas sp. MEBiC 03485]